MQPTLDRSMVSTGIRPTIGIGRHFTSSGRGVYDMFEWGHRDAVLTNAGDGTTVFEQLDVEFPTSWSTNASNIVAQKYFRGHLDSPERECSLRTVVDRIVDTIADWGRLDGYFADDAEAETFTAELKYVLATQRAAFNSPVWFNIGVDGVPQQASACFILSVDDTMDSILGWYRTEGLIFKRGSGAGVNLSSIRSSAEPLEGGGTASGPISFMRGADASAGAIKSGGTSRRAAKMVILDIDHPDIEEFIGAKVGEERKIRVLRDAGFDVSLGGADLTSIQFQNANNSVRVPDEFMTAVENDGSWDLRAVTTDTVLRTVAARALWHQINEAAWECADPGLQFDTTINRWHTTPNSGRINASNPCSEYFHLDDSACNLTSLNLLAFTDTDGGFDLDGFTHSVGLLVTAQDILVGRADYPTPQIASTTTAFRQLGLGFANLGAMLMTLGIPYDSDRGRSRAAAVTSLMTASAYAASARIAARLGPFAGHDDNAAPMLDVLREHRNAAGSIKTTDPISLELVETANRWWDDAITAAERTGVRNSQVTVLAPTGTIGLAMDCDTTGIEPDFALVKTKQLLGGGSLTTVSRSIPRALSVLGYTPAQSADIEMYIETNHSAIGAPHLTAEDVAVFACANGDNAIHYEGHLRMMAAVQPLLSGGISKTVNLPTSATVEDVEELHLLAWRLGIKSVAIYRDGCKTGQPLSTTASHHPPLAASQPPERRKLPRNRPSRTLEFRVADCKGFATVGEYDDGKPGEIFLTVSKQGSTMAGVMDAFAKSISYGLQYGVPIRAFVQAFTNMRFEPAGMTDDPDIRLAASLMDYLFRRLAIDYMSYDERAELGIFSVGERLQPTLPGVDEPTTTPAPPTSAPDAPMCMTCGVAMVRAGSCHVCQRCGTTSGCS